MNTVTIGQSVRQCMVIAAVSVLILSAGCVSPKTIPLSEPAVSAIEQSQALIRACQYEEAEAFVQSQLAIASPDDRAMLLVAHGIVAENRGDLDAAIARYEAAAAGDPVPAQALRFLGLAQIRTQQFVSGYRALNAYLREKVNRERAWPESTDLAALAIAAAETSRLDEAESLVSQALDHINGADPVLLDLRNQLRRAQSGVPAGAGAFWAIGYGSPEANRAMSISFSSRLVERRPPAYPRAAASKRIEGRVLLMLDIDETGAVTSVEVVEAEPKGVFETAAIKAARKWRFKPTVFQCQAVRGRGLQRLDFMIEE